MEQTDKTLHDQIHPRYHVQWPIPTYKYRHPKVVRVKYNDPQKNSKSAKICLSVAFPVPVQPMVDLVVAHAKPISAAHKQHT
jgi:hypothetical protein